MNSIKTFGGKFSILIQLFRRMSAISNGLDLLAAKGHIQLILGPMFSGKTTELIRRMRRFQVANQSCMMIKYSKDDRFSKDGIATHDKLVTKAYACSELNKLFQEAKKFGVIGIDEGQFFPDVLEFCEAMADCGKMVIVAALDGTFQRKPFGKVLDLIPLAENVIKLKAVCQICYTDAAFTKRIGSETAVEVIGGADKYMAVCRSCYKTATLQGMDTVFTPTRDLKPSDKTRTLFPHQDFSTEN